MRWPLRSGRRNDSATAAGKPWHPYFILVSGILLPSSGQVLNGDSFRGLLMLFYMLLLAAPLCRRLVHLRCLVHGCVPHRSLPVGALLAWRRWCGASALAARVSFGRTDWAAGHAGERLNGR